jgi:hypothetical protein
MDDMRPVMTVDTIGDKYWRLNGQIHREDGPAVIWDNGTEEWAIKGKNHRIDGPAIEWANGTISWYLNGKELSFDEWLDETPDMSTEDKVMFKLKYG